MPLVLNEEQRFLQDTAREFLNSKAPVSSLRALRDSHDPLGYSAELWQEMSELGWASIILPEEYGGLDFGFLGLGMILEESGRTLTASPLQSTAVIGASAILLAGSEEQKQALLPQIAAGKLTLALALEEGPHHRPTHIKTSATAQEDHYVISGKKTFVLDGHSADKLIVVARSSGDAKESAGLSLFLIDADAPGINIQRTILADSRNSANITFDEVRVPAEQVLGTIGEAWEALEPTLDRARIALATEMMGLSLEAFERTVAYLKEREQFGQPIGSFQALQHRAAHLYCEIELCRSVIMQALTTVDESSERLPLLASLAKATLNKLAKEVTNEAVQMHGGIGVTDELDIGFFLKRARVAMQAFGDTGFHTDRYASQCGY